MFDVYDSQGITKAEKANVALTPCVFRKHEALPFENGNVFLGHGEMVQQFGLRRLPLAWYLFSYLNNFGRMM